MASRCRIDNCIGFDVRPRSSEAVLDRQSCLGECFGETLVADGEILEQVGVDALGQKLHAAVTEQEKCPRPRMR